MPEVQHEYCLAIASPDGGNDTDGGMQWCCVRFADSCPQLLAGLGRLRCSDLCGINDVEHALLCIPESNWKEQHLIHVPTVEST